MDAVHLMRAITGRDLIVKIEGSYHGHHDAVMVSRRTATSTSSAPSSAHGRCSPAPGIPQAIADLCRVVPFNDLDVARAVLDEHAGRDRRDDHRADDDERRHRPARPRATSKASAGSPAPRRAAGLRRGEDRPDRRARRRHRTARRAAGHRVPGQGAGRRRPLRCHRRHRRGDGGDRRRLATSRSARSTATRSRWPRPGPCSPRCSRPTAYAALRPRSAERMLDGAIAALGRIGVPAYGRRYGAKGCVVFHPAPVRDYREFLSVARRASATPTGWCSTTAACSCRRGARASSGRCPCSTRRPTPTASSPTSRRSRRCFPGSIAGSALRPSTCTSSTSPLGRLVAVSCRPQRGSGRSRARTLPRGAPTRAARPTRPPCRARSPAPRDRQGARPRATPSRADPGTGSRHWRARRRSRPRAGSSMRCRGPG